MRARLLRGEQEEEQVSDARLADLAITETRYEAPDALEDTFHFSRESCAVGEQTTREIPEHLIRFNFGQLGDATDRCVIC